MIKNKFFSAPKIIVLVLLVGALAGASYFVFFRDNAPVPPDETNKGYVNLKPATTSDKADSESHKQASTSQGQSSPSTGTRRVITPVITTWSESSSELLVNGFVSGVVEDGGTCTLTLTKGSAKVSQTKIGAANASNTTCGQITIPLSSLPSGTWQAILSYGSPTSHGSSASESITVN